VGLLVSLMVAEKSGFAVADTAETQSLREFADRMSAQVMQSLEQESSQLATIAARTGNGESRFANG
jgi:hypothetical protein